MIIGSELFHFDELTSTNSHAGMMLRSGSPSEGSVIHTDFQSAGRGRGENRWESEKGKNLLFSVILYPESMPASGQFMLSMAISLAICHFLDAIFSGSKIKWPNDIYYNDDKIAGILIENNIMGNNIESAVAGAGININQLDFPEFPVKATSLRILTGRELDLDSCLKRVINEIDRQYARLLYGDRQEIKEEYLARLYKLNERHRFYTGDRSFDGVITGVSEEGLLRIREDNAKVSEFGFREVGFKRPHSSL